MLSWSAPLSASMERRLSRFADLGERVISIVLFTALAARVGAIATRQPWNLAILLPEGMVVMFMVLRRRPQSVSTRPWDWLVGLFGTALPMLVAPGGQHLASPAVGLGVILTGAGLSLWAKLSLRRSFGLAAANRGIVRSGAYNFVRHPIYAGYLLSDIGFLLLNASPWNLGVYGLAVCFVIARIRAEERLLGEDPVYADFAAKVRYRIAPGLY